MANIYEQQSEELHKLLTRASSNDGATVVIPDLQRPFVWEPGQVVLLLDSLIRGWPFGTLLMWKVEQKDVGVIPHREFWQVVDRTEEGDGEKMLRKDPPAQYHMVLDGQQRVQSLLLALGGDGWGFRLEDRDWTEQLTGVRPRGRKPRYPHWSKGTLCFNVNVFMEEYERVGDVIGIDYRNVLLWAVTDPAKGRSSWPKPDNYKEPLPTALDPEYHGNLIRVSRLWGEVSANPNLKEKQFRDQLVPFLEKHEIAREKIDALLSPLAELASTLRDVKTSKVTYLELRPYDSDLWTEDEYNGAVVNIFTRLNTAGRTLTREEITFAWLKAGWDPQSTDNRTAGACFELLLQEIREKGLPIDMDDLVRAVSFIWSVSFRSGELLSDKDLLKGDTVQPMARDLARSWSEVVLAVHLVLEAIESRELRYGQNAQFYSVNSIAILWTWSFLAQRWARDHALRVTQEDSFNKTLISSLQEHLDRWLICSHWAGRWGSSSSNVVAGYAKDLHADSSSLTTRTEQKGALDVLTARIHYLTSGIADEAATYVRTFTATWRDQVSRYNTLLWVWHRLDPKRWEMSRIQLRAGRSQVCDLEVDHTVAYSLWEEKVNTDAGVDDTKKYELTSVINGIGNCALLEKTFNISKSKRPLKSFLEEVHEFSTGQLIMDKWAEPLGIPECMLDPTDKTLAEIRQAIESRDSAIRNELVEFVQGKRSRTDIDPGA